MFLGKVVGTVWSTKKVDNLKSLRFLIVHPINLKKDPNTDVVVVADRVGAGVGETVICAYGRAARLAVGNEDCSIEAAVVGIVDSLETTPEFRGSQPDLADRLGVETKPGEKA
ncbi:MAG: EutN/CcmL family microcompartment protein [Candidatus Delongbacteria bacterium]|nr:EutN/CcmL family microcompartment protein [Candidatus Delongbacteria bacterium]